MGQSNIKIADFCNEEGKASGPLTAENFLIM
jgi:hypothetical protein